MKNKVFEIVISIVLAIVLVLQIITMVAVFGDGKLFEKKPEPEDEGNAFLAVNIDTPYCTMKYPSDWIDYLKIQEPEVDDGYVAIFVCEMNDKKAELFTVRFGEAEEENVVGTITKDDVPVKVALVTAELDRSIWTDEEFEIVSKMQKAKDEVVKSILEQKEIP